MEEIISKYKPLLTARLKQFLQEKQRELAKVNFWGKDTISRLTDFATRGKMVRGGLTLFSAEMFGSKNPTSETVKCALALELTHSALLVHDDIMDQDLLRRGNPTVFAQYQKLAKAHRFIDHLHYGESLAICFGDLTIFLAFEILSSLSDIKTRGKITTFFAQELAKVCLGQMQDVHQGFSRKLANLNDTLSLYTYKTARYTFSLSLVMGALLTEQNSTIINNLEKLGEIMGILFQIKDDKLGLFGESETTGKPVGGDIKEGKQTLYYFYLYQKTTTAEKQKLEKIFGNQKLLTADIDYFQQLLVKHGIPQIIENKVRKLESEAHDLINKLPVSGDYHKQLENLLQYLRNRSK